MRRARPPSACLRLVAAVSVMVAAACLRPGGTALAQSAPLTEVDRATEVHNISFRFLDTQTFSTGRLKEYISHTERGRMVGLRRVFGFLPFVPPVGVHPFLPVELARDAVRLERFYERNGFLFTEVDWLVRLDAEANLATILFTIDEGPPLLIDALQFRGPDGRPARERIAPELRPGWERFRQQAVLQEEERLDEVKLIELEEQALSWTRNHGYPFSEVSSTTEIDTLRSRARVTINVDPGPQARVASISVEGNERVRDGVVLRELPFDVGDIFSQRRLIRGQREVFSLDIFRLALVDVPDQPPDSLVHVRARVREHDLHAITAQVGYMTEAGLTGQLEWMHRNFLGDARTFTATLLANTGWLSTLEVPDRRFRAGASVHQPYFFNRHVSATAGAFAERRSDIRDDSRAFGGDLSVLYERQQFRSAAAGYQFEDRRLLEPPVEPLVLAWVTTGEVPPPPDPGANAGGGEALPAQPFDMDVSRSMLNLRGNYGTLDNAIDPRRGYLLRPAVQFTVPVPYTRLDYRRARLAASGYLPFGERIRLAARGSVGRLFPGPEPADEEEAFLELLRLRDAVFLAGGAGDVRGWATGMLGPKVLDLTGVPGGELAARRYFALGGTMRVTGTAEARYDLTRAMGAFVFLDAGRVWTPQPEYQVPEDNPLFDAAYDDPNRVFVGTGAGVSFASPIGGIQLALGYKVNPSFFDVRNPDDIARAFAEVLRNDPAATNEQLRRAAEEVEPSSWRRFRLHIAIGQVF